jgi:hypothetical protein
MYSESQSHSLFRQIQEVSAGHKAKVRSDSLLLSMDIPQKPNIPFCFYKHVRTPDCQKEEANMEIAVLTYQKITKRHPISSHQQPVYPLRAAHRSIDEAK